MSVVDTKPMVDVTIGFFFPFFKCYTPSNDVPLMADCGEEVLLLAEGDPLIDTYMCGF